MFDRYSETMFPFGLKSKDETEVWSLMIELPRRDMRLEASPSSRTTRGNAVLLGVDPNRPLCKGDPSEAVNLPRKICTQKSLFK